MITVITHVYNEAIILPFFIEQYKKRFNDCKFIIYDHMSTDGTYQFLLNQPNVSVRQFNTNGKIIHSKYLNIKNNAWKEAATNWVCVSDSDEIININEAQLKQEKSNIIKFKGFNMVNMQNSLNHFNDIKYGVRDRNYDKFHLFNKKYIEEINYSDGAHTINPKAFKNKNIIYSEKCYHTYHYHFIDVDYCIKRYDERSRRLSQESKKKKLGIHYLKNKQQIISRFHELRRNAVKVI